MTNPADGLVIPAGIRRLADAVHDAGGRAWLVGGGIRDHLMGRPVKDFDIEVHGLPLDRLETVLRRLGSVNAVGRSFGVFKLRTRDLPREMPEIDVSIPRRDSDTGPGHRGITVEGDPFMSLEEAVRRRDLTINALMLDVRTRQLVDPSGGLADLERGVLRAVDHATFLEDPLRALRVVQFAGRTGFTVDPSLEALCREAPLEELPPERVQMEWAKLLLKATHHGIAWAFARRAHILERVFPEAPRDPEEALLRAQSSRDGLTGPGLRWALMLAVWLARCSPVQIEATLDRLWIHKVGGFQVRTQVLALVAHRADATDTDAALRHLSVACRLDLALPMRAALDAGFPLQDRLARAKALGIRTTKPPPLLQGRDLKALGMAPGPAMGRLLAEAYALQLDGDLTTPEAALDWVQPRLA